MRSSARKLGLASVILGASIVSGCVSNADNLYRSGQIDAQQHAQMKAQENQRDDGLVLTALGALIGMNGIKTGNAQRVFAGDALKDYGVAQAGSSNVYVSTPTTQPVANASYVVPQSIKMPDWKVASRVEDKPLILNSRSKTAGEISAVVSNYFIDINKDGNPEYPKEFRGLRTVYLPEEDITLTLFSERPSELALTIYDSSGSVVDSASSSGKPLSKKFRGKDGSYRAEFKCEGNPIGDLAFEINPDKLRFEKR